MGIRKSYGKNKKTGRHKAMAIAASRQMAMKPPKSRRIRGAGSR